MTRKCCPIPVFKQDIKCVDAAQVNRNACDPKLASATGERERDRESSVKMTVIRPEPPMPPPLRMT